MNRKELMAEIINLLKKEYLVQISMPPNTGSPTLAAGVLTLRVRCRQAIPSGINKSGFKSKSESVMSNLFHDLVYSLMTIVLGLVIEYALIQPLVNRRLPKTKPSGKLTFRKPSKLFYIITGITTVIVLAVIILSGNPW